MVRYDVKHYFLVRNFTLSHKGLYRNGTRAGSYTERDGRTVRISDRRFLEKVLVYFYYHGVWSDYYLHPFDGDKDNNSIFNLVEEGERLIRLKGNIRYDPKTDVFLERIYDQDLSHTYEVSKLVFNKKKEDKFVTIEVGGYQIWQGLEKDIPVHLQRHLDNKSS